MLKYLIVQLDDTSTSFCHYERKKGVANLISLEHLRSGLRWAMKENLMVQFVYPDYGLPLEYLNLIDSVDHSDIKSNDIDVDVPVYNGLEGLNEVLRTPEYYGLLRLDKATFFENIDRLSSLSQVNMVITDIDTLTENEITQYKECLQKLANTAKDRIANGIPTHINILTDRLQLANMNNCNAGVESITLAPDGNFYICPGFYFDGSEDVGNPTDGLEIPNAQLYKLKYAPICRTCDAFHCKRCVWLNKKNTHEVNTPSHEQCVASHIERNASRELLSALKASALVRAEVEIKELDYLDPFEKIVR